VGQEADPALHLAIELVGRALALLGAAGAGAAASPHLQHSLSLLEAERKAPDGLFPASAEDGIDVRYSGGELR
jgi:hypothetical protein